jgi:ethanolamine utilization protein EutQ
LVAGRLPNLDAKDVERIVRGVVEAKLGAGQARAAAPGNNDSSFTDQVEGVCFISGERVLKSSSGPVPVAEKVMVADALYGNGDARLAGGFMEWEGASFPRTVESAEIGIVLQGELHLTVGGQTRVGKPGDMIYFPKGSKVIYSAPSRVRLACVNCVE